MVEPHQLQGLAADHAPAVERATVRAHLTEAVIIERAGDEAAAARQQVRPPGPVRLGPAVIHDARLLGGVEGVAVGQPVGLVGRHLEEGVIHAERGEDALAEIDVERPAGHALHHRAEHVGGNRVVPRLTRRELKRQLAEFGDETVQVVAAMPLAELLLAVGGVDIGAVLEAIGEAGSVAEQVQHPHRLGGRLRRERHARAAAIVDADALELRQDVVDRRVDRDQAVLDQLHERHRSDRLGHRGDAEQRALVDLRATLSRRAQAAEMRDLAVARDQQLRVGQQAGVDVSIAHERVDPAKTVGIEAQLAGVGLHRLVHTPISNPDRPIALSVARINSNLGIDRENPTFCCDTRMPWPANL